MDKIVKAIAETLRGLESPTGQQLRAQNPELQEAYAKMWLGLRKLQRFICGSADLSNG